MPLSDGDVRRAVETDLDRTIFLEAGAGSGKTTCLVARVVALVESGVPADRIAAITFTEKAAAELGDRVRHELHERADTGSERCRAALDVLDRAALGTLHAFARRILNEHPIEAGLPPRVQVLDEIASQLAFEERWDAYVDALLDEPAMERPLRLLLATGGQFGDLHDVAALFDDSWDLVEARRQTTPIDVPPVDVDGLLEELDACIALKDHCIDHTDRMLGHLDAHVTQFAAALRAAFDDDGRIELLSSPGLAYSYGQKGNWPTIELDDVKAALKALDARCAEIKSNTMQAALLALAESIATFTVEGAHTRQVNGELEFHDLLVLARRVLRDPQHGVAVRAQLHERYQRLLLDEFQDTDPIQVDLAVLIGSTDRDAATKPWQDVPVEPGRLFFVGDPKQSIYRFRRADIAVFLRARDQLVGAGDALTTSFRTVEPIVTWVNEVFGRLIHHVEDSQPEYVSLVADRVDVPPVGPAVAFVGDAIHPKELYAADLRAAEAADVVAAIKQAHDEQWSVEDTVTKQWRAPRWRDIAILVPARTSLPFLEHELETLGIPYRAETSSLVYGTREVRDLLQIARAVDDPTDSLAVVAALRTPALGCGDDDLLTWHAVHHGSWDHQRPFRDDAPLDHPVALGLAFLAELHEQRLWLTPSRVLERIIRERRLMEQAVSHPRPRDLWRRLRFVLDQARAWEEAGGGTLRQYLTWTKLQATEGTRVQETVLPETDDDAVRILTVHGAKGLEFPITVLSGMTTEMKKWSRGVEVRFPADAPGWAIKLRKGISTAEFDASEPIDEQMDRHERLRLLYVAATRARDHLIVSVHRKERKITVPTAAEALHAATDPSLVTTLDFDDETTPVVTASTALDTPSSLVAMTEWQAELDLVRANASRRLAVSATTLAEEAAALAAPDAGLKKDARDVDLPPWQKGRYGTAIGRAVHAVMQTIDLKTGAGLEEACAAQAAAEGVLGNEDVIEQLCQSALDSDIVKRAADRPHWREVYVGVPHDDGILEGYIDLLYRDDDGLVVVDYKTDAWSTEAELDEKVQRYAVQLRAYTGAVSVAVGEQVARSTLLFVAGALATRHVA